MLSQRAAILCSCGGGGRFAPRDNVDPILAYDSRARKAKP